MKLLMLATDNYQGSGAFRSLTFLARSLMDLFGDKAIVILPYEGDGSSLLLSNRIPFRLIPSYSWVKPCSLKGVPALREWFGRWRRNHRAINEIRTTIRSEKIECVYINTSFGYVGAIAAIKEKVPYVWHIREYLTNDFDMNYFSWRLAKKYFLRASSIVCVSEHLKDTYLEKLQLPPHRIKCIHNGIRVSDFYCKRAIFKNRKIIATIVGGVSVFKGQYDLVDAIASKAESLKDRIEITVVGDNGGAKKLNEYVLSKGVAAFFNIVGYKTNVADYLRQSDILFMCSRCEAFGRVTVEGMLAGCLAIGSASGGTLDIISHEETGLLYSQGNPDDLAKTIQYALDNPERMKKIAASGQDYCVREFTVEKNAKSLRQIFKMCTKSKG